MKAWNHRMKGFTMFQENINKIWLLPKKENDSILNAVG